MQIFFEVDAASRVLAGHRLGTPPTLIRVYGSGRKRAWEVPLTDEIRLEAEEELARLRHSEQ